MADIPPKPIRVALSSRRRGFCHKGFSMKEISGRTAVVTGAGGGMGRSIALELAAEGVSVAVVDLDKDAAEAVAAEISASGGTAAAYAIDVSKLDQVEQLADDVYAKFGSVEILVNNAGVTLRPFRASWDTSYEDFQWVMAVNFWGVLHGHHVFVPRMRETPGEKHILNTSSMASLVPVAGHSAYSASKSAVDGLSHATREELKTQNIGVTILHPGPVRTRIVTSERFRSAEEQSDTRGVKSWTEYVTQPENPVEKSAVKQEIDADVAASPWEYITPDAVGRMAVDAIKNNKPHVLTHPAPVETLQGRFDDIVAGAPAPRQD
ncbi:SDR family NAD(P)-dependent oxidoreductase [Rhodococcus sp. DMU1]|uniref:SDR family NAD(P)-dependent oxidoreductase n=1 Tax=Rhodococcus sp. DMU1 TaxID=2722825 RepID=UPI00143ED096|nr:SDR family NAD(P)-dependent oxidoreductase [Rhodococcus sp. DMU1]QIX53633.1 SDR family NAD(P)-dependent oxidoreductase [Rhodococcus sp. DMU1]